MSKRVTVMIGYDVDKKLRIIQANAIQKTKSSVSYSSIINQVVKKNIK
jgi:hypothetical protein